MLGIGLRITGLQAGGEAPLPPPPINTVAPAVTGAEIEGQTLTVSDGTWANSPTSYAYQWFRAITSGGSIVTSGGLFTGNAISGADASTYVLSAGDAGEKLYCEVIASNMSGSATAQSNATGFIDVLIPTPRADARAEAIVSRGGSQSSTTIAAVKQLEIDLILAGLINKLIYLNPRCGSDLIAARSPLIAENGPGYDTVSGTHSTWNELLGIAGSSGVFDTGVNAAAAGLTITSASLGVYMLEDATANAAVGHDLTYALNELYFSLNPAAYGQYIIFDIGEGNTGRAQTDNGLLSDGALTKGLIVGSRYSASDGAVFRNGVMRGHTSAAAITAMPTVTRKVYTNAGRMGGDFIGLGLTPDDVALLTWIMHDFNNAIGRGVTVEGLVGRSLLPAAFTFTDATEVVASSVSTSNTITVSGLTPGESTPVSITGNEYSKNGGAWSSAATTAVNSDTFAVRHTNSAAEFTATNTTLTIGGVSDTFTSTTTGVIPPAVWGSSNGFGVVTEGSPYATLATRSNTSGAWRSAKSSVSRSTGKRFATVEATVVGGGGMMIGLFGASADPDQVLGTDNNGIGYWSIGAFYKNSGFVGAGHDAYTDGDDIGVLWDATAKTVQFNRNGGAFSATVDVTSLGDDIFIGAALSIDPYSRVTLINPSSLPSGATKWDGST